MEFLTASPGHRVLEGQMHHSSNICILSSCFAQEKPGKMVLTLLCLNWHREGRYQKKQPIGNKLRFNFLKVHYLRARDRYLYL